MIESQEELFEILDVEDFPPAIESPEDLLVVIEAEELHFHAVEPHEELFEDAWDFVLYPSPSLPVHHLQTTHDEKPFHEVLHHRHAASPAAVHHQGLHQVLPYVVPATRLLQDHHFSVHLEVLEGLHCHPSLDHSAEAAVLDLLANLHPVPAGTSAFLKPDHPEQVAGPGWASIPSLDLRLL